MSENNTNSEMMNNFIHDIIDEELAGAIDRRL